MSPKDARHVCDEFFKKFPLKDKHTYETDWELFLAFLWLRGFKIVRIPDGEMRGDA